MNTNDNLLILLDRLRAYRIEIKMDDGRLLYRTESGAEISPKLIQALREHKAAIVEHLRDLEAPFDLRAALADHDPEAHYLVEERAAIMEFDGGLPRLEAERLAWRQLGRHGRPTGVIMPSAGHGSTVVETSWSDPAFAPGSQSVPPVES